MNAPRLRKLVLVVIATALIVAAPAFAASWHVVKSKSVSGEFAVTAFNATVKHPLAMKLRLSGTISSGNAAVACSRGFTIKSYGRTYSHAGTYKLPVQPRRAGSCQLTVGFGVSSGSGRATLYVYR